MSVGLKSPGGEIVGRVKTVPHFTQNATVLKMFASPLNHFDTIYHPRSQKSQVQKQGKITFIVCFLQSTGNLFVNQAQYGILPVNQQAKSSHQSVENDL